MVSFRTFVTVDHHMNMAKPVNSTEISAKSRGKKGSNSPNHLSIPDCQRCRSAWIDVMILIAAIGASGFLLLPYINLLTSNIIVITRAIVSTMREEISEAPLIYGCLGLSILCAMIACSAVTVFTGQKCGKPGCRGLRKAAEFDIQLETEECVKNSSNLSKDCVKKGLFELPRDHHRELEAELKKMAPTNGRAVLVFRARCGCSVGRMEVLGPKKARKVKK